MFQSFSSIFSLNTWFYLDAYRLDTFTEDDLEELQDEQLEILALQSKQRLRRLWSKFSLYDVLSTMRDSFESSTNNISTETNQCINFKSFHKYMTIVGSRAMVLNGKKYLTPMPDFTNYEPRPQEYDDRRVGEHSFSFNMYHSFSDEHSLHVRTDRSTSKGQQIFEDYGANDNSLYLEMFGFVPQDNPFNCAMLDLKRPYSIATLKLLKQLKLIDYDVVNDRILSMPNACVMIDGNLTFKQVLPFFAVVALSHDPIQEQRCIDASKTFDWEYITLACFRYPGHISAARLEIGKFANSTLMNKRTTLGTDLDLFHNPSSSIKTSPNRFTALAFRIQEKKILSRVSAIFSSNSYEGYVGIPNHETCTMSEDQCGDERDSKILQNIVDEFNKFMENRFEVNYLKASIINDDVRLGAVATKNLSEGEVYVSFDAKNAMSVSTAMRNDKGESEAYIELLKSTFLSGDKFHCLLFYVFHEYFMKKDRSKWSPYLQVLPTKVEIKQTSPLWYTEDSLDFLSGSDLRNEILSYQHTTSRKFNQMMTNPPVISAFGKHFTRDNYFWAHAMIDTRAIWWNGERHLVPLLDLVNCSGVSNHMFSFLFHRKS